MKNKEGKKVGRGIEYLLELNAKHSDLFLSQQNARRFYRREHPTEIAWLKCMDGRVHGSVLTNTPFGIIQPFRSLGGKFNLGWPGFAPYLREWVKYSLSMGRNCVVFITYHYSRGEKHRGCKGFDYDVNEAIYFGHSLKKQFDRVFRNDMVYSIQVGIETDRDALVLHGEDGSVEDLSETKDPSPASLFALVHKMYPQLSNQVITDILRLISGNINRIAEVHAMNRPVVDMEHKEWVLGVGMGFDWLHEINTALLVGPYDPEGFREAIGTAAGLIVKNIEAGRVDPKPGIVLLCSASHREPGMEENLAVEKAQVLHRISRDAIERSAASLFPFLQELVVTIDMTTRKIKPINI